MNPARSGSPDTAALRRPTSRRAPKPVRVQPRRSATGTRATSRRPSRAPARRRRSRWRPALVATRRAIRAPPPRRLRARPIHGHVSVAAHSRRRVAESRARTLLEIPLADAVQAPTIPSMNTRVSTILVASWIRIRERLRQTGIRARNRLGQSALARNPAYEIVATDESTGVFTVRDTATGTVQTLRLEDLVAGPKPAKVVAKSEPVAEPVAEPVEMPPAPQPAHHLAEAQTTETVPVASAAPGQAGLRHERPGLQAVTAAQGPGYTITRQAHPARRPPTRRQRRTPHRSHHLPGRPAHAHRWRDHRVHGDAVVAEKGCDLYISNARIHAGGVGIIARQARVHIVNSTIGGTRGSYEASEGAEIYVARSTFTGVGRRFDSATMNDLGGNNYN